MIPKEGDKIIFINCNAKEYETIVYKYYKKNNVIKLNKNEAIEFSKNNNIEIVDNEKR